MLLRQHRARHSLNNRHYYRSDNAVRTTGRFGGRLFYLPSKPLYIYLTLIYLEYIACNINVLYNVIKSREPHSLRKRRDTEMKNNTYTAKDAVETLTMFVDHDEIRSLTDEQLHEYINLHMDDNDYEIDDDIGYVVDLIKAKLHMGE